MPGEELYNTKVTVVMNITAANKENAVARLTAALAKAGFDTVTDVDGYAGAFLAEEGTEPNPLPGDRTTPAITLAGRPTIWE
jgi:hypothetical protein